MGNPIGTIVGVIVAVIISLGLIVWLISVLRTWLKHRRAVKAEQSRQTPPSGSILPFHTYNFTPSVPLDPESLIHPALRGHRNAPSPGCPPPKPPDAMHPARRGHRNALSPGYPPSPPPDAMHPARRGHRNALSPGYPPSPPDAMHPAQRGHRNALSPGYPPSPPPDWMQPAVRNLLNDPSFKHSPPQPVNTPIDTSRAPFSAEGSQHSETATSRLSLKLNAEDASQWASQTRSNILARRLSWGGMQSAPPRTGKSIRRKPCPTDVKTSIRWPLLGPDPDDVPPEDSPLDSESENNPYWDDWIGKSRVGTASESGADRSGPHRYRAKYGPRPPLPLDWYEGRELTATQVELNSPTVKEFDVRSSKPNYLI